MCESFFATLECELLARRRFAAASEARPEVFESVEGWHNPRRRHPDIAYMSPVAYEQAAGGWRPPLPQRPTVHESGATPMSQTKPSTSGTGGAPERQYRKPPVVEALCEIHFGGSAWDDAVPGSFYERIKDKFPQKQARHVQEAQVTPGSGQSTAGVRHLPPRLQFVTNAGDRVIQVAKDLLVVNQLAPYPHFEEWEQDIYQAMADYKELAQPKRITRVGLRYMNRIEIDGAKVKLEDFFTIYPNLPGSLGDTHGSFMVRVEVPKGRHTVLITFGVAPPPPDRSGPVQAFALDLYDVMNVDEPIDDNELKQQVHQAHSNIVGAFEDSVTDRLRKLFEPEGR